MNKSTITPVRVPVEQCRLVMDFQEGDLLFGLEKEARSLFRPIILQRLAAEDRPAKYLTIDDINKILSPTFMFNDDLDENDSTSSQEFDPPVLEHLSSWKKHQEYFPTSIKETGDVREQKIFINSCIVALLEHKNKIRFCLDGLDIEAVRDQTNKFYSQYTSSELRLCAQRWDTVKERVIFYEDGQHTLAPWLDNDPLSWLYAVPKKLSPLSPRKDSQGGDEPEDFETPVSSIPWVRKDFTLSQSPSDVEDADSNVSTPIRKNTLIASLVSQSRKGLNFDESASDEGKVDIGESYNL